jgi:tight adherence protein C
VLCILFTLLFGAMACWQVAGMAVRQAEVLDRAERHGVRRVQERLREMPGWVWYWTEQLADTGRRFGGGNPEAISRMIIEAGQPMGLTVQRLYGIKAGFGLAAMGVAALMSWIGLGTFWVAILPPAAFVWPTFKLKSMARDRQVEIGRSLPDFMDTVAISLEAGMTIDAAFRSVAERFGGPLGEEIVRYAREVDLGVPRDEAFSHVLARNSCKDLTILARILVQSARLGVPMAGVMSQQGRHMRRLRAEKAKEQAAKASPKMTLATSFLMMPAVLFFIVSLVVLNLIYNGERMGISNLF